MPTRISRPVLLLALLASPGLMADGSATLVVDEDGIRSFHFALSRHYHVAPAVVARLHSRKIPHEHLPIVFLVANRASVSPGTVVELRLTGRSWMEIAAHFGLGVEIFHVHVTGVHGPPYGKAFGHFRRHGREDWGSIRLTDEEVVVLANLKFLSAYHGRPADDIIRLHREGRGFVALHGQARLKFHRGGHAPGGPRAEEKRRSALPKSGFPRGKRSGGAVPSGRARARGGARGGRK